jgi:predicted NBD/HSP70 family sugar kinase
LLNAGNDVWIGVDGGATSVKAGAVRVLDGGRLALLGAPVEHAFGAEPGFSPVELGRQLTELARGCVDVGAEERAAGAHRIGVYAQAVCELARRAPEVADRGSVQLALCAPGRTGSDRRGLLAVRNGPRQPRFLDELERALRDGSLPRLRPPASIDSDGTAAGWGEQFGVDGAFVGVEHAYAVGCGTGVAESLKVDGRLCEAQGFPDGWRVPWQADESGRCEEDKLSMSALTRRWREVGEDSARACAYPEPAARAGLQVARGVLQELARALADFLAERFTLLQARGVLLQRVVLAQRAAALFADPELEVCFAAPLRARLEQGIGSAARGPGFLVPSRLRSAPVLGTVARALGWPAQVD